MNRYDCGDNPFFDRCSEMQHCQHGLDSLQEKQREKTMCCAKFGSLFLCLDLPEDYSTAILMRVDITSSTLMVCIALLKTA